ncbi:hypothetical protein RBB50_007701 [Rhinocladiella similis]
MSADLFAAFATADDNHGKSGDVVQQPAGKAEEDLIGYNLPKQNITTSGRTVPGNQVSPLWKRDVDGSDVLFDAEDDFGEFEIANTSEEALAHSRAHVHTSHESTFSEQLIPDLLDDNNHTERSSRSTTALNFAKNPGTKEETNLSPSELGSREDESQDTWEEWSEFDNVQDVSEVRTSEQRFEKNENRASPSQATTNDEDEWEPFEDGQTEALPQRSLPVQSDTAPTDSVSILTPKPLSPSFERPTNVPPPSSLLQLMSAVFDQLHQANIANDISKPALATKVLLVYRTASRLAAGRSLRWKRDTLLSQSMRIGQAGTRGGMKLASVNKGETAKESRDSEEMIRDWTKNIHEYNTIIAQAGLPPQRLKMSAAPSLKMQKPSGSSDNKQCALCGLKRTERVVGIDVDTDDLFGEFWTEHWGHKDCYEFWYSNKGLLAQR